MQVDTHSDVVPLNPVVQLRRLWGHRALIGQLTRREVGARYRGSYFGLAWQFMIPMMMLTVYTVLFGFVFKSRWQEQAEGGGAMGGVGVAEFALTLFAGLIPFNLFAEVVSKSPSLVLSVPSYVKKVVFPLDVLTVTAVGGALVNVAVSLVILVLGIAAARAGAVPWTIVLVPVVLLPLVLLTLGTSWLLASLGTYVRDIGQFISVALQALLFMSPVFWPASKAPAFLVPLLHLNPLAPVVEGFRQAAVFGVVPHWGALGAWTVGAGLFAWVGYVFFMYTKRGFADVM